KELGIGEGSAEELGGALDPAEGVPDLVREAARDRAERGETVGAARRRLEGLLHRQVVEDEDGAARGAGGVEDGGAGGAHRDLVGTRGEAPLAPAARRPLR